MSISTRSSALPSLGRFGGFFFARQHPFRDVATHAGLPGLAARFGAWLRRRAAAAELAGLSDRELADIGITRQQIPDILRRRA